ncbi:protein of unknown function [Methylocella tundrae]|uniref:Uncharacterized protein n=1 Tax=Methylocella tundrae TaxID=227605 RepID=A0A4U8Z2M0_METTU|nr:protein of unknown function [Methylocella tundrae]
MTASATLLACLDRVLGVAHRLLNVTFGLLHDAFSLQLFGADGLADALLDMSSSLVGEAGDLVFGAAHC